MKESKEISLMYIETYKTQLAHGKANDDIYSKIALEYERAAGCFDTTDTEKQEFLKLAKEYGRKKIEKVEANPNNVTYDNQSNIDNGQEDNNLHKEYRLFSDENLRSFYSFINRDEIDVNFDDLVAMEEPIKAVNVYFIYPRKNPKRYNDYHLQTSACMLLQGPPGTGKTTFAKAVAKEMEGDFIKVIVPNLVSSYVGETAKNIVKFFDAVREYAEGSKHQITIFFDEFDSIAQSREGEDKASSQAVPALLDQLDGMNNDNSFLILANTNYKDKLDKAILDRFKRSIYIPLPNFECRKTLFAKKLAFLEEEYAEKLNLDLLAEQSEGLSGRRINNCCDDFYRFIIDSEEGRVSLPDDLNEEFLNIIKRNN